MPITKLLNGCYRSQFSVIPKNWNTGKASTAKNWRIHYRFYDPSTEDRVKQVSIQGMNNEKSLRDRQSLVRALLERETELIDTEGFNPITGKYMKEAVEGDISELTHFIPALQGVFNMLNIVPQMKLEVKSALKYITKAAGKLFDNNLQRQYTDLRIGQVRRKHLIYILQQCKEDNPMFSNYRKNKYRGFLLMLFKRLLILEAVDSNPAMDIPIEKHVYKKRVLLTQSERLIINTNLKAVDYCYWRYVRIFFRSGSRGPELLSLKNDSNINLEAQEFTTLVRKGKNHHWVIKPIPDDTMEFWREVVDETKRGEYLFSTGFKPGAERIGNDQPNKRWKKLVKVGMGIQKDLNSLRNLNADSIDEQMGLEHAAAAHGHADSTMVRKHYAVNNEKRLREELKGIKVDFV